MTRSDLACCELVELVTDYLEGALPAPDRERFEAHLRSCRGCAAYLRQMRDLVRVSGRIRPGSPRPAPPPDLLRAFAAWKAGRA
ncbi:MAG TPA: zf-HC2 domain-containing protein [Myxococcales bacterium]|nr:zf-HC2 domain-containing protein [Myxococcales bacterium]